MGNSHAAGPLSGEGGGRICGLLHDVLAGAKANARLNEEVHPPRPPPPADQTYYCCSWCRPRLCTVQSSVNFFSIRSARIVQDVIRKYTALIARMDKLEAAQVKADSNANALVDHIMKVPGLPLAPDVHGRIHSPMGTYTRHGVRLASTGAPSD